MLSYIKYMATHLSGRLWGGMSACLCVEQTVGCLCSVTRFPLLCSCQNTHRPTHPRWPLCFPLREIDGVFKCFLSSQMAPGRWLHAITIIYPDAGCQGVSSAGLFAALWSFQDLTDRYSIPQSLSEALHRFRFLLSLAKFCFLTATVCSLTFLPFGDSWGVTSGTHPSACLCVHPHLSLPAKAFRGCPHKSVRQMGGRLFTCHLRDVQATQSAAHNAVCLNLAKPEWWINATA